ncbi:hypothetical protein P8452_43139 [Trifolium repens]|nr:hypothetical protein P8452_43139 [Trifolium repens]
MGLYDSNPKHPKPAKQNSAAAPNQNRGGAALLQNHPQTSGADIRHSEPTATETDHSDRHRRTRAEKTPD